ncbi:MAG: serine hydrolase [Bacteroidota bacterium]
MLFRSTTLLLFCLCSQLLFAQAPIPDEFIAPAYPLSGITIDGELSDWPQKVRSYPIANRLWGDDAASAEDYSGSFKVGYSQAENALYIAVKITDEEQVENENPAFNNQDTYTFYINEQYKMKGSGIVRYTVAENFKDATDPAQHWDPLIGSYISWDRLDYQIKTKGNTTFIELKYTLKEPITVGRVIGVGQMVADQDGEVNSAYGWVGRSGKSSYAQPGRIGSVIFADEGIGFGTLTGKVVWRDTSINLIPSNISVTSAEHSDQWFYLPVTREGDFSVTLPAGDWVLNLGANTFLRDEGYYRVPPDWTKQITVESGKNNTFEYVMKLDEEPDLLKSGNLLAEIKKGKARKKVDAAIEAYMDYYEIEGVSFATWKDGKITYKNTYGVKNNYTGEKVNSKTLFEVASITKPTFAYIVLRLYEKGVIDLDEPLYKHLEFDLIKDHEYAKLVTARHVLSHSTGFPNWANGRKIEFRFKPGNGYSYSGEGFEYLKRVIQKITGKNITQVFQEELIEPLGLEHFYYVEHPYGIEHKSNGHYDGYPGMIDFPLEAGVAWSLVTTPESYMKFADAIHQRKGLKPETYEMMLSKQNPLPNDDDDDEQSDIEEYVGIGWFVEKTPYGTVIKHGGNNGDFMSQFKLYDDLGTAFFLTTNGYTGYYLSGEAEKFLIDSEKMEKQLAKMKK